MAIKKVIFLLLLSSWLKSQNNFPLIPQPNQILIGEGQFIINAETKLVMKGLSIQKDLLLLNTYFFQKLGYELQLATTEPGDNFICFEPARNKTKSDEAYQLKIEKNKVTVTANAGGAGFFYAIQSMIQLTANANLKETNKIPLPCLTVLDEPRFVWRGMHLDVCRHFFTIDFVKKYIDLLALYKMNTFHWHLTEDQGWRIEIKKYPKLTSIGGWRKGTMVGKYSDQKFDTIRYGGFYTQDEIKAVVAYALDRHITIVPEIEMPGHSVAAIAAYPYLSCTGKKIEVERAWGVFDDVYCTKDSTFEFLQNVLDEVVALFPGKYIHIGGDECPKTRWKSCPNCQNLIKREKLKDENELQSYFITRIEKYLNTKGKQIIGWDEILEGGLAPNAAVMSWRGTEGGIAAAKQKHKVVMSPGKPCYFDHYQIKDKTKEPLAIGGFNPIDSVYAYDPMPESLGVDDKNYIMGAQANVWTEYILTSNQVEYMALPRMCAMSEVLWTKPENKDFNSFIQRLKVNSKLLDEMTVNYAKHFLNIKP